MLPKCGINHIMHYGDWSLAGVWEVIYDAVGGALNVTKVEGGISG